MTSAPRGPVRVKGRKVVERRARRNATATIGVARKVGEEARDAVETAVAARGAGMIDAMIAAAEIVERVDKAARAGVSTIAIRTEIAVIEANDFRRVAAGAGARMTGEDRRVKRLRHRMALRRK